VDGAHEWRSAVGPLSALLRPHSPLLLRSLTLTLLLIPLLARE
jgi:hypothetical protein